MHIIGQIVAYDEKTVTIEAPFSQSWLLEKRDITNVSIWLDDGRTLSALQRKKIYALIGEIAKWSGYGVRELADQMKLDFIVEGIETEQEVSWFSLSPDSPIVASMTTARRFITFLIEYCLAWDIRLEKHTLLECCEDIGAALYSCLFHKRCAICGQAAEYHHATGSRVGMGRNRDEVPLLGTKGFALCRKHHDEAHHSEVDFCEKYHVYAVKVTQDILDKWREKD